MSLKKFLWVGAAIALSFSLKAKDFNVVDFGAVGDGVTLDTPAIQRAIDAAAVSGGRVMIPRRSQIRRRDPGAERRD